MRKTIAGSALMMGLPTLLKKSELEEELNGYIMAQFKVKLAEQGLIQNG